MASFSVNDLVLQLQLVRDQAPTGTVPVQASMYLSIAFGRPPSEVFTDKELVNCPLFLDHATFVRTVRRLLPLDEHGSRSEYTGSAPREDLAALLKTFGRDADEVDNYMTQYVPEEQVPLNKFLRILAKPIAGQRYPIGIYTVSRPLEGPPSKSYAMTQPATTRSRGRDRSKAALGMPIQRDAVALAFARRIKYAKYRSSLQRQRGARRNSDATDTSSVCSGGDLDVLTFRLCGLEL